MRKRIVSTLLALCLVLTLLPGVARAAEESGTCGDNLTWSLENGTLTIQGTGPMEDYTAVSSVGGGPWNKWAIKTINIGDGVTSIGENAFYISGNLTSVTIPNSVTNIGDGAFSCCYSLTDVTIPDSVISIGTGAFSYCESLPSVTIPDSVTSIGSDAFSHCTNLVNINVASGNSSYVSVDDVLYNTNQTLLHTYPAGKSGTIYNIPNSVTEICNGAFAECSSLTRIDIPSSVTSIGDNAFYFCSGLTSVTIPNNVTSIGDWAFDGCSSLTNVTIPESVTSIGFAAFSTCSSLTSVTILNGVTTIEDYAFSHCGNLANVIIPGSVTSIGEGAFAYNDNLKDVYYDGSESQWKGISIGESNEPLLNATIHYSNEPTPEPDPTPTPTPDPDPTPSPIDPNPYPTIPSYPSAPSRPSAPKPSTPSAPETPAKPETPAQPETPAEPTPPVQPQPTPDTPTTAPIAFSDVAPGAWYKEAVDYVSANNLMTGTSATEFSPSGSMTRAMVWTVLGRMDGADVSGSGSEWFAKAQAWAVAEGVSDGSNPNGGVARQELVTMLWRSAGSPAAAADLSGFSDGGDVAGWAGTAMQWAVSNAVLTGDNGALKPAAPASRAEVAAILTQFCQYRAA